MIFFIAPSGGNNSYICLKLIKKDIVGTTTYHDAGSHSDKKEILNFYNIKDATKDTKIIITENYNNIKNIVNKNDIVIQNYIDQHREMLLLNWFHKNKEQLLRDSTVRRHERFGEISRVDAPLQYGWRDSWLKWQTDLWKNNSKKPIVSAVAEWMYKLFDDNFAEIKRIPEIEKVFNWSVMYETPEATVDEFKKIGYNYTVEEHNKWLDSQEDIIGYWMAIKQNIETPLALEDDVHKGIALALHGRKHDLIRQQVESKFKLLP